MKATGKYAFSFNEEENYQGAYDTVEEAIEAAKMENTEYDVVYIGERMEFQPVVDPDDVIEELQQLAYDEALDFSDDYLNCSRKDIQLLGDMLTEAFNKWAKDTNNEPSFFVVENIEAYRLVK